VPIRGGGHLEAKGNRILGAHPTRRTRVGTMTQNVVMHEQRVDIPQGKEKKTGKIYI